MRTWKSPLHVALALSLGCDTLGRANHPDEALYNCEVLQSLVTEHCGAAEPGLTIQCSYGPRVSLGKTDPITDAEGCVARVCDAALEEAERQCERGSTANFFVVEPLFMDSGACCLEPAEDCMMWLGCN